MGRILENAILTIMSGWGDQYGEFSGFWYGYNTLQDELHDDHNMIVTLSSLRLKMKKLKDEGVVILTSLVDYEGKLAGRGYIINENTPSAKIIDHNCNDTILDGYCFRCGKEIEGNDE